MQPYQKASQALTEQKNAPGNFLKKAALAAPAVLGGGVALNRILPFLSDLIPPNLAAKGLEKIDSRFGKFINGALGAGHSLDEVMGFVKDKVGSGQSKQTPDQRSIIEQYSPELSQFIQQKIQEGRSPLEAGALAQLDKKFKSVIKQMETDHKTPFSSILEAAFGSAKQPQQSPQAPQQGAPQGQGQQVSSGQQALMNSMQKLQAILERKGK